MSLPVGDSSPPRADHGGLRVAAVVLAAGQSTRTGRANKLLADLDGEPLVRHVVERVVALPLAPVIVVTGHEGPRVEAALVDLRVRFVDNAGYRDGIGTSVATGVRAARAAADGVLVVLGDMPWLEGGHVRALVSALEQVGPSGICVPTSERRRGNPVLWGASHFDRLCRLEGDMGARTIMVDYPDDIVEVAVARHQVFDDIDTIEALEHARRRIREATSVPDSNRQRPA